ncbi:hypothetical protein ANCDUO_09386 [Ancylostoma duodenale]|uniref:Uncharacterized protein n=1 Tax=Ancylostoma duodenale TaxID=51022 RepID=A0A0C2GTA1_9BILA|nr:hypothetical protein ANCDUO_09386 [Ancylostoma duodenale]
MNATRNSVVGVWGRTTPDKTKIEKATRCWNEEVQSKIAQKKSTYKRWMLTCHAEDRDAYLAAKREAKKSVVAKSKYYKELYDTLNTSEERERNCCIDWRRLVIAPQPWLQRI